MAKVKGPLLSLSAKGTIAQTLTFSRTGSHNSCRLRAHPPAHTHPTTQTTRNIMSSANDLWHSLTDEQRDRWIQLGRRLGIGPFAAFCKLGWKQTHAGGAYPQTPPTLPAADPPTTTVMPYVDDLDGDLRIRLYPQDDAWSTMLQWNDSDSAPDPPENILSIVPSGNRQFLQVNPDPKQTSLHTRAINRDGLFIPPTTSILYPCDWCGPPFRYYTCGTIHHDPWIGISKWLFIHVIEWSWPNSIPTSRWQGPVQYYDIEPWPIWYGETDNGPLWAEFHCDHGRWIVTVGETGSVLIPWSKHPCRGLTAVERWPPVPQPPLAPIAFNKWYLHIVPAPHPDLW